MPVTKKYEDYTFKERLTFLLHNEIAFDCRVELKEIGLFHTCKECTRKANRILIFLSMEVNDLRKQ